MRYREERLLHESRFKSLVSNRKDCRTSELFGTVCPRSGQLEEPLFRLWAGFSNGTPQLSDPKHLESSIFFVDLEEVLLTNDQRTILMTIVQGMGSWGYTEVLV